MCEHYIAHGLCTDFPDWTIAAAGSEASLRIGYDYGRLVTGEEQEIESDFDEEVAVSTDGDQVVPDPLEERSMVATSAEVRIYVLFFNTTHHNVCFALYNVFVLCGFRH